MARRVKSLTQGLGFGDPYESPHPVIATGHREHRSKKGRTYVIRKDRIIAYKKKLEELKIEELENEKKQIIGS